MNLEDVRDYEKKMHEATNEKLKNDIQPQTSSKPSTPTGASIPSSPKSPTEPASRSWFSWS